jgi:hypothetical protein
MKWIIAFLLLISPALAEEKEIPMRHPDHRPQTEQSGPAAPAPQQTIPAAQVQAAIGQKLMEEINGNIQLRAQLLQLQDEIEKIRKEKPAAVPPPPPSPTTKPQE